MARPSDCIYCRAPTGSREHSFPAGLGGRGTNKGILCSAYNQAFSPLDAVLKRQLNMINGLLGVRPDHGDEPDVAMWRQRRPDASSTHGLSPQARAALELGASALAFAIAEDLGVRELSDEQLRQHLSGGLGMSVVGGALIRPLSLALQDLEAARELAPRSYSAKSIDSDI